MFLNIKQIKGLVWGLLFAFFTNAVVVLPAQAQPPYLPNPGLRVSLSPAFNPPVLKGIKVHPDNPFRFDFILDQGDEKGTDAEKLGTDTNFRFDSSSKKLVSVPNFSVPNFSKNEALKQEATKLIKYFLASLTVPEKDLWVNLSPYEKDRIVPESFGLTEMGRDLLAQDYLLKQITASLIYPEDEFGKKFWKRIYEEVGKKFGTTDIPVNTFNKVWIVPEKAVVYENAQAGTAYVVESKLKVMLEEDYLAVDKNRSQSGDMLRKPEGIATCPQADCQTNEGLNVKATQRNEPNALASQIVREIVIPQLTKEINENKNFAQLRQVYNSLILATWYKKKIKDSILNKVYADKNKVSGIGLGTDAEKLGTDTNFRFDSSNKKLVSVPNFSVPINVEHIYQQYLQAFKKGVYNYIKEEQDPITQQIIPRKYFSGGFGFNTIDSAMSVTRNSAIVSMLGVGAMTVGVLLSATPTLKQPAPVGVAATRPASPQSDRVQYSKEICRNFLHEMQEQYSFLDSQQVDHIEKMIEQLRFVKGLRMVNGGGMAYGNANLEINDEIPRESLDRVLMHEIIHNIIYQKELKVHGKFFADNMEIDEFFIELLLSIHLGPDPRFNKQKIWTASDDMEHWWARAEALEVLKRLRSADKEQSTALLKVTLEDVVQRTEPQELMMKVFDFLGYGSDRITYLLMGDRKTKAWVVVKKDRAMVTQDADEGKLRRIFPGYSLEEATGIIAELTAKYPHWNIPAALELPDNELVRQYPKTLGSGENWDHYVANQHALRGQFLLFLLRVADMDMNNFKDMPAKQWIEEGIDPPPAVRRITDLHFSQPDMTAPDFVHVLQVLHRVHIGRVADNNLYRPSTNEYATNEQIEDRAGELNRFSWHIRSGKEYEYINELVGRYRELFEEIKELKTIAKEGGRLKWAVASIAKFYMISARARHWIFRHHMGSNSFFMNLTNMFLRLNGLIGIEHGYFETHFVDGEDYWVNDPLFLKDFIGRIRNANPLRSRELPTAAEVWQILKDRAIITTKTAALPDQLDERFLTGLSMTFGIKQELRAGWVKKMKIAKPENVAEHTWGVALLSLLFAPKELDLLKVLKIAIVHDMHERISGDTPYLSISRSDQRGLERRALDQILEYFPGSVKAEIFLLWNELVEESSAEARFVGAMDRVDSWFQEKAYWQIYPDHPHGDFDSTEYDRVGVSKEYRDDIWRVMDAARADPRLMDVFKELMAVKSTPMGAGLESVASRTWGQLFLAVAAWNSDGKNISQQGLLTAILARSVDQHYSGGVSGLLERLEGFVPDKERLLNALDTDKEHVDGVLAAFDKIEVPEYSIDHAALAQAPGGIDFNADKVDSVFAVKKDPREKLGTRNEYMSPFFQFHIDPAMLEQLQNAPGFMPVIISVQPLKSLPEFLGITSPITAANLEEFDGISRPPV